MTTGYFGSLEAVSKKGKFLLKKSGGILCKGDRLEAYRFIEKYHQLFGLRWLLDLYDRSVAASITDRHITTNLAIRTLKKALDSQPAVKGELILHSNQGAQYTSEAFVEFCRSVHVTQSMSRTGCSYDNAPMERYFNTLKNECINLYEFQTEEALYQTVKVMGRPDNLKLRSSMTLFSIADSDEMVFKRVLEKFYKGKSDGKTLKILGLSKDNNK